MNLDYCDSHTHLLDNAFNEDRNQIIEQSIKAGVRYIAEIACEPNCWEKALALQNQYPENIYLALGLHPHNCDELTKENLQKLKTFAVEKNVSAIGEIGLDYAKSTHSKEKQFETLITLLTELSILNKPLILHCRNSFDGIQNAYEDLFLLLKKYWISPKGRKFSGILHCFSATELDAKKAIDMGLLIGVNATLTYHKNEYLREIVKKIGLKNIITETDCPYLPPQTQRGKRNSPLNILQICAVLSDVLKFTPDEISKSMASNFLEIFK